VHVLVTADTLSGAWAYTRELVTGLVTRGVRVTLVSFGEIPLPEQTTWMDHLHGLEYLPTAFRLEWMQEAEEDLPESSAFLATLVREVRPDLLHLNQFCYGNLPVKAPRVVMAHGDLITFAQAVQDKSQPSSRPTKWYRDTLVRGMAGADAVVAPSAWMLDRISESYGRPERAEVIYPGRNPIFFNPYVSKDDCVLAVGGFEQAGLSPDSTAASDPGLHRGSRTYSAGSAHSNPRRRESFDGRNIRSNSWSANRSATPRPV
jgi:glycogen(starch) synthase